jgi:excisionase family DNA binding protein
VAFLRGQTRADEDILTVEGAAKLLHCTIDTVRRIPDGELRAHQGPGRHLLYLRDEVIEYVRRSSRDGRFINPVEITDQAILSQPGLAHAGPYFSDLKRKARSVR